MCSLELEKGSVRFNRSFIGISIFCPSIHLNPPVMSIPPVTDQFHRHILWLNPKRIGEGSPLIPMHIRAVTGQCNVMDSWLILISHTHTHPMSGLLIWPLLLLLLMMLLRLMMHRRRRWCLAESIDSTVLFISTFPVQLQHQPQPPSNANSSCYDDYSVINYTYLYDALVQPLTCVFHSSGWVPLHKLFSNVDPSVACLSTRQTTTITQPQHNPIHLLILPVSAAHNHRRSLSLQNSGYHLHNKHELWAKHHPWNFPQ